MTMTAKTTKQNHAKSKEPATRPVPETPTGSRLRGDILADTRATFRSDHGRRELSLLLQSSGFGSPSFVFPAGGSTCPFRAAFIDGRKSIVQEILDRLDSPEDAGTAEAPKAVR
jgi:hypothetical protein